MNSNHPKFNYDWNLSDGYPESHGKTVMTTFACGGGSTMGYKLAGFKVIAANDIDPQMARVYQANHHPDQFFLCGIRDLLKRDDLPKVDVLDGSPPCSVFSMSGSREDAWQKDKVFREGQSKQILDDLFFDFIDLVEKMQPPVVIAENVKGMLIGNAKWFTREIVRRFNKLGYQCQIFLLNGATMGVPQRRERVFFIAHKTSTKISMNFAEKQIQFSEFDQGEVTNFTSVVPCDRKYWSITQRGKSIATVHPKGNRFNSIKIDPSRTAPTIASGSSLYHHNQMRQLTKFEIECIGSWPHDYNYLNVKPQYLIGMSVPPLMMAHVADTVYNTLMKGYES